MGFISLFSSWFYIIYHLGRSFIILVIWLVFLSLTIVIIVVCVWYPHTNAVATLVILSAFSCYTCVSWYFAQHYLDSHSCAAWSCIYLVYDIGIFQILLPLHIVSSLKTAANPTFILFCFDQFVYTISPMCFRKLFFFSAFINSFLVSSVQTFISSIFHTGCSFEHGFYFYSSSVLLTFSFLLQLAQSSCLELIVLGVV